MTDEQKVKVEEYIITQLGENGNGDIDNMFKFHYLLDHWEDFSDLSSIEFAVDSKRLLDKETKITSLTSQLKALDPSIEVTKI